MEAGDGIEPPSPIRVMVGSAHSLGSPSNRDPKPARTGRATGPSRLVHNPTASRYFLRPVALRSELASGTGASWTKFSTPWEKDPNRLERGVGQSRISSPKQTMLSQNLGNRLSATCPTVVIVIGLRAFATCTIRPDHPNSLERPRQVRFSNRLGVGHSDELSK